MEPAPALEMKPTVEDQKLNEKMIAHETWMRREERKWFPNLTGEMDESSSEDEEGDRE